MEFTPYAPDEDPRGGPMPDPKVTRSCGCVIGETYCVLCYPGPGAMPDPKPLTLRDFIEDGCSARPEDKHDALNQLAALESRLEEQGKQLAAARAEADGLYVLAESRLGQLAAMREAASRVVDNQARAWGPDGDRLAWFVSVPLEDIVALEEIVPRKAAGGT